MAEPAPTPPPPEPEEQPRQRRSSPLLRMLQVLALAVVAGLLTLLVWRVVHAGAGGRLVADVRSGKKPAATQFTLPVLWARAETWPKGARRALADSQLSLRELRGTPVVINFLGLLVHPVQARGAAAGHPGAPPRGQVPVP